jgi:transcriptional regulator with XRE-family HTH domain
MVKLSELRTAEEIHEQDMQDPEYRREYERTRLATDIAVKVIQYRADHGLSQTALGGKLGMSQPNVARLEAGEHLPSVETLARLASVLGLDFSIDVTPDRVALRYASRRGTRAHLPSGTGEIRQRASAREKEHENA